MSDVQYPIKGACQCGGVTYELLAAPSLVAACHCKECQKLSTSAFSITAMVGADPLSIEGAMEEWQRLADSGNVSAAKFCPTCGNRIYHYNPADPQKLKLKVSNLEDTRLIQPTVDIWVGEKWDWFRIPEGVRVVVKQP